MPKYLLVTGYCVLGSLVAVIASACDPIPEETKRPYYESPTPVPTPYPTPRPTATPLPPTPTPSGS